MKFTKVILLGVMSLFAFSSCEDFLDSQNYTGKDSTNFPGTEKDVDQMVAAVYKSTFYAPFEANTLEQYFSVANLFSDDMFGGAGKGDPHWKALGHLMYNQGEQLNQLWVAGYEAIARANAALAVVDNIADEEKRNQTKGELLFHRAYNYYNLVLAFNNVPVVSAAPSNVGEAQIAPEQTEGKEIFKLIAQDLKDAVAIMPSYTYDGWSKLAWGKVSRWAVETLMARAYLFYTGFYGATEIPTTDGGSLTKTDAINAVEDIIKNSGHSLLADYRSLWAYSNQWTAKDYEYVNKDQDILDANGVVIGTLPALTADTYYKEINPEVILAINFNYQPAWTNQLHLTNQYALFFGIRADANNDADPRYFVSTEENPHPSVYPFGGGWGVGPVNPGLYKSYEEGDIRRDASIIDMTGLDPNTFSAGVELTMFHNKKITAVRSEGGEKRSWTLSKRGSSENGNYQASHTQPLVLYRLADVYLMHAELTQTNTYMTPIRQRAGLEEIPYSLEALKAERRHELAFEGVRWDDLRRWGDVEKELPKMYGEPLFNEGAASTFQQVGDGIVKRYQDTKGGFYRIPQGQINLSGGAYKQNPGWEGTQGFYSGT